MKAIQLKEVDLRDSEDHDIQIVKEYNRELKATEQEMYELKELVKEHSFVIMSQGQQIDKIEQRTESVDSNIHTGTKTLEETNDKYDKIKMTKAKIAIVSIGVLTGSLFGGPLGLLISSTVTSGLVGMGVGGGIGLSLGWLASEF